MKAGKNIGVLQVKIPGHIAIIMDGNGRWARKRGLPRVMGHRRGAERVRQIVREAKKMGVKALTVFAFSTENWNRPQQEKLRLFSYFASFLEKDRQAMIEEGIRLVVIGRRDRLSSKLVDKIVEVENATQKGKQFVFTIAFDYGGRWDIIQALQRIEQDAGGKEIAEGRITERKIGQYLCLAETGDPDLLIRTSGELRISNFLLWQLAYTELYFTKVLWPDFNARELAKAIEEYGFRQRRFGRVH